MNNKINTYSFGVALHGASLAGPQIPTTPDILPDVWGFLFLIPSQVIDAGPFWTAKLGYQEKTEQMSYSTTNHTFLCGLSFLWLKIWSNLRRSWKHYRTGLIIPSKNCDAMDQVYRN